ncbi:putative HTH-type transcriptional regulator YdcR [Poriferisphaera corsica]|uniref:Putative HTH-type transcriptional regulator YdcR n=1 Tax=Poriferisphaera corsica TaxID=2528020 RepID=A0A517YXQ4_9BACT|nr:PLP-dependent aminotransferase family protein [Poriferisphaera corsica]QDU35005.1 putative HTH-type transcriptional regulator YdcR [Poriferisphaera corsica]
MSPIETLKKNSPLTRGEGGALYEQLADRIEGMIVEGVLLPGDRVPSVRKLKQQFGVSMSTVLEACRLLEDRGLVSARPQSGHYVRENVTGKKLDEPSDSRPKARAVKVDRAMSLKLKLSIEDESILHFGAAVPNTNCFPQKTMNRLIGQALREESELVHKYNTPRGVEEFRKAVCKRMMYGGISVGPEDVLVTNGTKESVYLALKAVTKPGDTVAVESPTYFDLIVTLESLHLKILPLATSPRDGVNFDSLGKALQMKQIQAVVLITNFSNPLGVCMSDSRKKALAGMLERYDVPLIEDDIYGDLCFGEERPKTVKAYDKCDHVIYCSSFSKTISPGMRVGWIVPGKYQAKVEQIKLAINQAAPTLGQIAMAKYLNGGGYERHLRKLRKVYQQQTGLMLQYLSQYFPEGTKVSQPTGGHVLWVEMPVGVDSVRLHDEAIKEGIAIAPGPIFSPREEDFLNCMRINTGLPWSERIEPAIKRLGELAVEQLWRSGVRKKAVPRKGKLSGLV